MPIYKQSNQHVLFFIYLYMTNKLDVISLAWSKTVCAVYEETCDKIANK